MSDIGLIHSLINYAQAYAVISCAVQCFLDRIVQSITTYELYYPYMLNFQWEQAVADSLAVVNKLIHFI